VLLMHPGICDRNPQTGDWVCMEGIRNLLNRGKTANRANRRSDYCTSYYLRGRRFAEKIDVGQRDTKTTRGGNVGSFFLILPVEGARKVSSCLTTTKQKVEIRRDVSLRGQQ